jgi:hypothetical protein
MDNLEILFVRVGCFVRVFECGVKNG